MFSALLKTRLQSIFSRFLSGTKKKKQSVGMKIVITLLFVYVFACFIFMFGAQFWQLCAPFHALGIDWFYFCMGEMMAMILMFIGSIFMTQSQIYEAKDNDLLLSMPIAPRAILLSRMLTILLYNLLFELLVFLPMGFVYQEAVGFTASGLISLIVMALSLPFLTLAITCIFSALLTVISSHFRHKSVVTMVLSIAFLGAYFYVYSRISIYMQLLILNGDTLAEKMKAAAPLYWISASIANGNFVYLILGLIICIVPFLLVYAVLSYSFIAIATRKQGFSKIKYREKSLTVSGLKWAMLKKELRHFGASPVYMMNASLGVLVVLVGVIVAIVKRNDLLFYLSALSDLTLTRNISLLMGIVIAVTACTNIITAPSISLEGKYLWISRSIPVRTRDVLMAKVNLHLIITVPVSLIASVLICIFYPTGILNTLIIILLPAVTNLFFAFFGLIINLHLPKFDWVSETAAVKQSASTMVAMLGSMALVIILGLLYGFLLSPFVSLTAYAGIVTILITLLSCLLYKDIITKGIVLFEKF